MEQTPVRSPIATDTGARAVAEFKTSQGIDMQCPVVRVAPQSVSFEVHGALSVVQLSEILSDFKVCIDGALACSGSALVSAVVNTGVGVVCEVALKDATWDLELFQLESPAKVLPAAFKVFMDRWQKHYKVFPEYKVLAADMHAFLSELRIWIEQVELGIRSLPAESRLESERAISDELSKLVFPALDSLFAKFETLAQGIGEELQPIHRAHIQRLLHPLLLSAPFAFRSVQKPLGYAGDYEIVNMILREPHEGASLFGKLLHRWFVKQPPAEAHRNRVKWLTEKLVEETARMVRLGKSARIYNLGCGPAKEVQDFLSESTLAERAHFTLLDFNEETLFYAKRSLAEVVKRHHRHTPIEYVKKSVAQVLRAKDRRSDGSAKYDFVYCAGLFDYLADSTCKQLMHVFYDMVAPGGLLVATNVDSSNPIRHWLSDVLEWHLIYRSGREFLALAPDQADPDLVSVQSDHTGVNIFLEVRKPLA